MWSGWAGEKPGITPPARGVCNGSLDRQDRLCRAGRHLLRARRLLCQDNPAHREASAWAGKGSQALGLAGAVDPDTFTAILEGQVPSGPRLGKKDRDGNIHHRPGRDVTLSAPKSVSLAALVGGDERIVAAHDRAVQRTLA